VTVLSKIAHNLVERRVDMANMLCKGVGLKVAADDLARKYGVSVNAIYRDWSRREKWMPQILRLQDHSIVYELLYGMRQIIPNAWYEYSTADNSNARIGSLRVLKETYAEILEKLQSLGLLQTESLHVEQKNRIIMLKGRFVVIGPDGKPLPGQDGASEEQERPTQN
jgi:hypothetical protein